MPQHSPARDDHSGKNGAKPLKTAKARQESAKEDEDAAMKEWGKLAELQFLDG